MQIGMIGLGRMGANMARRLMRAGHECVVYDRSAKSVRALAAEGATGSDSLEQMVELLRPPRAAWLMVPAGDPTESTVQALGERMQAGDIIIDGGNTFFKNDVRRARELQTKGIHYVDVGTSGGVWGLDRGFCLMVGGPDEAVKHIDSILKSLSPGVGSIERTPRREGKKSTAEEGYLHCGPVGAGHFVKMIHNGIEYGLMQAYAEGFDILRQAFSPDLPEDQRFDFDLADIAEVWRRGSVIGSWLLDLTAQAMAEDADLSEFSGYVSDSGEGRWTLYTAIEEDVPAEVLATSLFTRFRSRREHTYADKVLSAMRKQFGGHVEAPTGE